MDPIRIGISGWTYAGWRGVFYPPGLPHKRELAYAGSRFNSIEINGTFYSLQHPGVGAWERGNVGAWGAQREALEASVQRGRVR